MTTERNEEKVYIFYTATPAFLSGAAQAILFNPFDKALYVRVKFRRKYFLDRRNFVHPFQGFMNAAVYRTLVGASYVFWQNSAQIFIERTAPDYVNVSCSSALNAFIIGMMAGSLNAFMLNGMQVVKYRMWSTGNDTKFFKVAFQAYRENGVCIFFRGIGITILRDCVFGVVYELFRRSKIPRDIFHLYIRPLERRILDTLGFILRNASVPVETNKVGSGKNDVGGGVASFTCCDELCTCSFIANLVAAIFASIMSAPFNYIRILVYSTPQGTVSLGALSLFRFFIYQVQFVYRHGESFTDANMTVSRPERKMHLVSNNNNNYGVSSCSSKRCFSVLSPAPKFRRRVLHEVATTAVCTNRHPVATWRWINTRLNIGWGSVRIGLGMAVGQALFYKIQSFL